MSDQEPRVAISAAARQLGRLGGRARWQQITSAAQRSELMRQAQQASRTAYISSVDPRGVMTLVERQAAAKALRSERGRKAAAARWAKHRQSQAQGGAQ